MDGRNGNCGVASIFYALGRKYHFVLSDSRLVSSNINNHHYRPVISAIGAALYFVHKYSTQLHIRRKHQKQMSALDTARITSLPENAYYIPNFITADEEEQILKKVSTRFNTAAHLISDLNSN
jgi:hypothetical protein